MGGRLGKGAGERGSTDRVDHPRPAGCLQRADARLGELTAIDNGAGAERFEVFVGLLPAGRSGNAVTKLGEQRDSNAPEPTGSTGH